MGDDMTAGLEARRSIFHGLSAFPITPADTAGRIEAAALGAILERLASAGVDSIGLLGSTGSYMYLDRDQRRRALRVAVDRLGGSTPLIVGVGAMRTDEARALALDAADCGADGLLLAPVSYTPLTEDEVFAHFQAVAEASDLPLCIYNNPGTTHFTFGPTLLARLAGLPRVRAVKMPLPPGGDHRAEIARLRAAAPEGFSVGYSGDWGCSAALLSGADAWFSVVAGILPRPALDLARAAQAGRRDEVARIEAGFAPLWSLFQRHGSLRVVHAIANHLGLTDAQPPRPILPLDDRARADTIRAIRPLIEIRARPGPGNRCP
jgi:4-hydroxy-tetrahydrodipicolinate synthase|tara:strand:+ start:4749 stop:5711 length:963 start_codon:yes stop_codon:yes gene_type:complete